MRVAAPAGREQQPLSAQAEQRARLRAGRDAHLDGALERRHADHGPERRLSHRHGHVAYHDIALALEQRVGLYPHDHVQIARWSAAPSRLALPCHAARRAVGHAGRDRDLELALFVDGAGAVAHFAWLVDDLAGAATRGAL